MYVDFDIFIINNLFVNFFFFWYNSENMLIDKNINGRSKIDIYMCEVIIYLVEGYFYFFFKFVCKYYLLRILNEYKI